MNANNAAAKRNAIRKVEAGAGCHIKMKSKTGYFASASAFFRAHPQVDLLRTVNLRTVNNDSISGTESPGVTAADPKLNFPRPEIKQWYQLIRGEWLPGTESHWLVGQ